MSKLPKGLRGVRIHTVYSPSKSEKKATSVHMAYTLGFKFRTRKMLKVAKMRLKEKEESFLEELDNIPFPYGESDCERDIHELDYKDRSHCVMHADMPCELCSAVCPERLKEWKAQGKLKNVTYENGFISYTLSEK